MAEKIRRLFLCRHGETEANVQKIYCGGSRESPLTNNGKLQASLLGKALRKYYKFQGRIIIASPKERAKETAKLIAENLDPKPSILTLEGLREMEMGQWCGKKEEEITELFPKEYKKWSENILKSTFRFPDGESLEETRKRMLNSFELVKKLWLGNKEESNNDIIIVAHGGTNMIILISILNIKMKTYAYRAMKQDNTCLNIIAFREKGGWRPKVQIALVNSTHHLDMKF